MQPCFDVKTDMEILFFSWLKLKDICFLIFQSETKYFIELMITKSIGHSNLMRRKSKFRNFSFRCRKKERLDRQSDFINPVPRLYPQFETLKEFPFDSSDILSIKPFTNWKSLVRVIFRFKHCAFREKIV